MNFNVFMSRSNKMRNYHSRRGFFCLIKKIIAKFTHPTLENNLIDLNFVQLNLYADQLTIKLKMPFPWNCGFAKLKKMVQHSILKIRTVNKIIWILEHCISYSQNFKVPSNIKNVIAISSAKGGVGKSSITANLAIALRQKNISVGILDADMHGPSIHSIMGIQKKRIKSRDGKNVIPVQQLGVHTQSMGYLLNHDEAAIWKGPMASKFLINMFYNTIWPKLDYLIIDMPPGTGDIYLALSKKLPVSGTVIISTPQSTAFSDVQRGIQTCKKLNIPIIGMLQNMKQYTCVKCGFQNNIFGSCNTNSPQIKLLGDIPFYKNFDNSNCKNYMKTKTFEEISERITSELFWQSFKKKR